MTDCREKLRSFLNGKLSEPSWVMTVMTRLEPFFQIIDCGEYPLPLPPKEELSDNRLFRALHHAFGLSITSFERVKRSEAALMTERREVLGVRHSYALGLVFAGAMRAGDARRLDSALDPFAWFALLETMDGCLLRPMANAVGHDLAPWLGYFLKRYVTALLADEQELFESMDELVKLLPYAFPVGSLADDPTVWVVLE